MLKRTKKDLSDIKEQIKAEKDEVEIDYLQGIQYEHEMDIEDANQQIESADDNIEYIEEKMNKLLAKIR